MISLGEYLQRGDAKVSVSDTKNMPVAACNRFVNERVDSGNFFKLTSYTETGDAESQLGKRNGVGVVPGDEAIEMTWRLDEIVMGYANRNFILDSSISILAQNSMYFSYPPGVGIVEHVDDRVEDANGVVIGFNPERAITALVYLNDEYTGGDAIFPNIQFKPSPGRLVIFPANRNFPHGMTPILSGRRNVYQRVYAMIDKSGSYAMNPDGTIPTGYNCCNVKF